MTIQSTTKWIGLKKKSRAIGDISLVSVDEKKTLAVKSALGMDYWGQRIWQKHEGCLHIL